MSIAAAGQCRHAWLGPPARRGSRAQDALVSMLLVVAAVVTISPIAAWFVPIRGNLLFIGCCLLVLVLRVGEIRAGARRLLWMAAGALLALAHAAWWQDLKLAFFPVYLALSMLTVAALSGRSARLFVRTMTVLMALLAAASLAGQVYAYLGGAPLLTIDNPDGRPASLYALTMTNDVVDNLIRPAGIFDEPGALAFYICLTAACRSLLDMPRRTTWLLLAGGLPTLSLAHLMYMAFHLLSEPLLSRRALRALLASALVLGGACLHPALQRTVEERIGARLAMEGGRLAGDNRSELLENAAAYVDLRTAVVGLDPHCITDWTACQRKYRRFGENILTPLVQGGILMSWPYYAVLAALLAGALRARRRLVCAGVAALLLQRPYLLSTGYCLLIVFFCQLAWLQGRVPLPASPPGRAS
jgi:hypothetical protein